MKRYTFGTFLVDDANREAFEVCRDVAYLRPAGTQPVSLVGEHGFGKTHLLYSIVNRVRGGSRDVGIAYVRGTDFPRAVRDLVTHPEPIRRVRSAILLVDDLDQFRDALDDLESVVRLFLEHRHYVVFASRTLPTELTNLSPGLLDILKGGRSIKILANRLAGPGDSVYEQMEGSDAVIARQKERIAELESRISDSDAPAPSVSPAPLFRPELMDELDALRAELARTRSELGVTESEIEHLKAENALLNVSTRELSPLRERLKELEEMQLAFDSEYEGTPSAVPRAAEKAREEANRMLAHADELINEVDQPAEPSGADPVIHEEREAENTRLRAELDAAQQRDAEVQEMLSQANDEIDRLKAAVAEAQAERAGLTEALPKPDDTDAQMEQELSASRAECDRLRGAIVRARAERETVKAQVRRTLEELGRGASELEFVRKQAAEEKEETQLQIAELERRLETSQRELEEARSAGQRVPAATDEGSAGEEEAPADSTAMTPDDAAPETSVSLPESAPMNIAELRARLTDSGDQAFEDDTDQFADTAIDDVSETEPQKGPAEDAPHMSDDAGPETRDAVEPADASSDESMSRPDFGEPSQRPAPRLSSTLHHVEEIRADLSALTRRDVDPPGADDDSESHQRREQSA